jgi:predicted transcriptional regulator
LKKKRGISLQASRIFEERKNRTRRERKIDGTLLERPNLYVVARFLEVLYDNQAPMKKTNIQMLVRMNYPRFLEYLDWLLRHELVMKCIEGEEDDEGDERSSPAQVVEKIALTPKGIEAYHTFVGWVRQTMEGMKL